MLRWLPFPPTSISIHSLRVEGDKKDRSAKREKNISIHSLRVEGDTRIRAVINVEFRFQSTPSAWRETLALRELRPHMPISIHSLRVEGDSSALKNACSFAEFQSTPSAWRETQSSLRRVLCLRYFNPLPPRGGRLLSIPASSSASIISIHSLRVEGDGFRFNPRCKIGLFQSTPSAWRETIGHRGC